MGENANNLKKRTKKTKHRRASTMNLDMENDKRNLGKMDSKMHKMRHSSLSFGNLRKDKYVKKRSARKKIVNLEQMLKDNPKPKAEKKSIRITRRNKSEQEEKEIASPGRIVKIKRNNS